jgi:serine O-acetyltransferase
MSVETTGGWSRFRDLVFSDLQRYRPAEASWAHVLFRCVTLPGMVASLFVRAMQVLDEQGRTRLANALRTPAHMAIGIDLLPGLRVGRGLMLAHPHGVAFGGQVRIGDNVTFAGGVTCAARYADENMADEQEFATIEDGALLGAHAVLVGGVRIGRHAMVGANSVVLSDVPDYAVVLGVPARQIGSRKDIVDGAQAAT